MKRLTALLAALLLVFSAGVFAAAEDDDDEILSWELPVDFTPGNPLNPNKFVSVTEGDPAVNYYEDPSICVRITTGNLEGKLYWIADIEINNATQLRTAAAVRSCVALLISISAIQYSFPSRFPVVIRTQMLGSS